MGKSTWGAQATSGPATFDVEPRSAGPVVEFTGDPTGARDAADDIDRLIDALREHSLLHNGVDGLTVRVRPGSYTVRGVRLVIG